MNQICSEDSKQSADVIEQEKIRISVRNLVEFVFRSGDIDNRVGTGVRQEAMREGSRMHRRIQKRMGSEYRSEVTLKHELIMGHYLISVEGRADGIFRRPSPEGTEGIAVPQSVPEQMHCENGIAPEECIFYIDEIKCMYTDVTRFEKPYPVHLAQAKCYAYIFALQNGLSRMGVQITYCELDTEKIQRFEEVYSFETLRAWFAEVIGCYRKWTDHQYEWNLIRRDSIKVLEFPFPYREGQKKLVGDVYRTIARKKILFLQAPTGTGKTIATVFPAVKAVGEGLADRIFYLTAKTITRTVAKDAFDCLKDEGCRLKVLTLTAKEKLCPCETMDCNPVNCPYAKGHYDRVNDAVFSLMTSEDDYTREILLAYAEKYRVCPFEMALDLSLWSDAVICDYNYVFDPNVYLKRFFAEGEKGAYLFLIDEAHNLVERGREMYSATLVKEDFLRAKRIFGKLNRKIASVLEKCNRRMLEWKRECEKYTVHADIESFSFSLMRLLSLMDEFLRHRAEFPEQKEITEFYFKLRHFMAMYELADENYVIYSDFDGENHFCLHLYCVNPASNLQACLDKGRSAVFFSATLLPVQYYKNLLSVRQDNYAVYAESAFQKKQRLLFAAGDVSSLYTRRNLNEFQRIAEYIRVTVGAKRGNYIAFFPSYSFMEQVYEQFLEADAGRTDCAVQSANMREAQREEFLAEFSEPRERSFVAFCVLGGIFSEGIDLKHDRLIGVLVVGTGLPQICNRREILKSYYNGELARAREVPAGALSVAGNRGQIGDEPAGQQENLNKNCRSGNVSEYPRMGFEYAYRYPGMNKVMQAAGRVIRTAADCGVIGLLDERFLRRDYRQLFPREWDDCRVCNRKTLPGMLEEFWKSAF
ncbi:MAG: ATP-dependent DNA helicase [Clostridiales bacterium]|nr:ATP-dependent DNA helicase [Clostridiales bacterium]